MENEQKGVEETVPEVLSKAETLPELPEDIRPYVEEALKKSHEENEALKKQVEEAMAKAAKLEDQRLTDEFMAKASEFDKLPTEGLGEILKEASANMKPESYEKLEGILRASNEQLAKSALFEEMGSDVIPPDSTEGKIKAATAEIMAKSENPVTEKEAELIAWQADPKAYAEHRNSFRRR